MKNRLILIYFFALTTVISCRKNGSFSHGSPKIKSVNGLATRLYDSKGRISRIEEELASTAYTYTDSTVLLYGESFGGTFKSTYAYKVARNGLATYFFAGDFGEGDKTFTYTAAGSLLRETENTSTPVEKTYFYTANSTNADSMRAVYDAGTAEVFSSTVFEYYTDLRNTLTNEAFGENFLGVSSANPIKKSTERLSYNGFIIVTLKEYSYEYDEKNRIILQRVRSGSTVTVTTYTYY